MPSNARVDQWAQQLDFAGLERRHGLPAGILTNLVYQESRGNPNARSPVGAQGLCQFMPATAREYRVNVSDPRSSVDGAARYLEDLMDRFNGDADKAIAAYNCGQGRVERLVRQHGANWRQHLPAETRNYLNIVGDGIGHTYAQRVAGGESIPPADREAEEARRMGRLAEAGFSEQMISQLSGNELLGMVFFALIREMVESRIGRAEEGRATETLRSIPDQEFTPQVMDRTRELKARDAASAAVSPKAQNLQGQEVGNVPPSGPTAGTPRPASPAPQRAAVIS